MNFKYYLFLFIFILSGTSTLSGSELPFNTDITPPIETEYSTARSNHYLEYATRQQTSRQLSFSSQTGFFLLRQEEIILLKVDSKEGGLAVHHKHGQKNLIKRSTSSLCKAAKKLNAFPFIKISRSAIVNFHEIRQYEGTRRDATLVMSDGTRVKVSRNKAGELHDYIKSLEV